MTKLKCVHCEDTVWDTADYKDYGDLMEEASAHLEDKHPKVDPMSHWLDAPKSREQYPKVDPG